MKYIKHIAGEFDGEIQRCIVCGEIIIDNRGLVMPKGSKMSSYASGPIYQSEGTNPRITIAGAYATEEEINLSKPCKP